MESSMKSLSRFSPTSALGILVLLAVFRGTLSIQFDVNSGNIYRFLYPETWTETKVGTVACTEAGGGALIEPTEYRIIGHDSLPFKLNPVTGILTLLDGEALDYELKQSYIFNVSCSYLSNTSTNVSAVEITVLSINEFRPELNNPLLELTIPETTAVGTVIASTDASGIVRYIVTDKDAGYDGELTWYLPWENNPPGFEIDKMSGTLTLTRSLDLDHDRELLMQLVLAIAVCDGGRSRANCVRQHISIIITPSNDNVPVFEQSQYEITVSEGIQVGTSIITVSCTDADRFVGTFRGTRVKFPENGPVHIKIPDGGSGIVIYRQPLDYDLEPTVTFALVCRNFGFPVQEDSATIIVKIFPGNNPHPHIVKSRCKCINTILSQIFISVMDRDSLWFIVAATSVLILVTVIYICRYCYSANCCRLKKMDVRGDNHLESCINVSDKVINPHVVYTVAQSGSI